MRIIIVLAIIILALLLTGCSLLGEGCVKINQAKNEAEAKISIAIYLQNHTISECYDYCKGTYWKMFPSNTCYTSINCANICTGQSQ